MDTLTSLRVFVTVADLRSFAGAAARLGLSPAMASKHLAHLERRVGARLLNRTSRRVSLTELGAIYLQQARQSIDALDEIEAVIGNETVAPRGTLKLSAPMWAATGMIARTIHDYHLRYPDVCLDMAFSGRIISLVEEGFDLALRATMPDRLDPGLIARPLMDVRFQLVGAPSHLDSTGRPTTVAELNGRALLLYSGMNGNGQMMLRSGAEEEAVKFRVVLRSENEIMLQLAAVEGMGLTFLPDWMSREHVERGCLETVLPDQVGINAKLFAVYPSGKYLSPKVRTFIDFFVASCLKHSSGKSE